MTIKEEQGRTIDIAWDQLYKRLADDNLLPENGRSSRNYFQPRILRWSAVAAVVCICIVSAVFLLQKNNIHGKELLVLQNKENTSVLATVLEDGSTIYLSENSKIKYPGHFEIDKRVIFLEGSAFFEISRQEGRPFFINTEKASIEVIGTSFCINTDDQSSFVLSVKNGIVKVTLNENNQSIYVNAGKATVLLSGFLQLVEANLQQFEKYFDKIIFKDELIKDVIRIINVNSQSLQIEVLPELENRRITTTFSGETPEMMVQLICLALNLNYYQDQNTIYITN
jgi:ferric-dicitrate binding protein FerR (iron transport regulator)